MQSDKSLLYLVAINAALLVASDAGGAKLIALPFGYEASVTVISYMLAVSFIDIINEFFGPVRARMAVNIGFVCLLISSALFRLFVYLPASPQFSHGEAYKALFDSSLRIALGGWTSYIVGQHISVRFFDFIKHRFPNVPFLIRKLMSDFVVQFLDTALFITVAFAGTYDLTKLIVGQYCVKIAFLLIYTPIAAILFGYIRSQAEPAKMEAAS